VYEACQREIVAHRQRQEELGRHAEDLVEELEVERQARDEAEEKLRLERREWEDEERKDRRVIDETQAALNTAKHDLELTRTLLKQRESDLAEVQSALTKAEAESRRAGESATSDRFSLNLELDRARRDLARLEEELARVKKDLEDRENRWREREGTLDKLYAENRDLAAQLAAQTQARLNVSEKLDLVQAHLRTAEGEVAALKAKVNEVETRLSKDQRNLLSSEQQYRDQLTERNTLLLTIYQYMDKILGVDKTTVRGF
jgi:chromosome segregation ATPase